MIFAIFELYYCYCSAILRDSSGALHIVGDLSPGGGDAEMLSRFAAFHGAGDSAAQTDLQDFLRDRRAMMNRPGGYWVFSITPEAAHYLQETRLLPTPPVDMLLMTDGFARLVDHFAAYTPASLLATAYAQGLDPLYSELRKLEANDADCRKAPRVKREDDASAVLVHIDTTAGR